MLTHKMSNRIRTIVTVAIVCVIAVGMYYSAKGARQAESDCSLSEIYNSSTGKCIVKTGQQYANEINRIDTEKRKAESETQRRNGTLCIPATEAHQYIGVDGCVRMVVNHYYIESYGWAWLDSGDTESDFTVAALGRGIITKSDAEYYMGKVISVRGVIESYQGAPEIKISSKDAIFDIESQEDKMTQTQEAINKITTNAQCSSLEDTRKKCEWAKSNRLGDAGYCSTYRMLQGQIGDNCKNYTHEESTSEKRAACFQDRIKSATSKTQKDTVYKQCQNP